MKRFLTLIQDSLAFIKVTPLLLSVGTFDAVWAQQEISPLKPPLESPAKPESQGEADAKPTQGIPSTAEKADKTPETNAPPTGTLFIEKVFRNWEALVYYQILDYQVAISGEPKTASTSILGYGLAVQSAVHRLVSLQFSMNEHLYSKNAAVVFKGNDCLLLWNVFGNQSHVISTSGKYLETIPIHSFFFPLGVGWRHFDFSTFQNRSSTILKTKQSIVDGDFWAVKTGLQYRGYLGNKKSFWTAIHWSTAISNPELWKFVMWEWRMGVSWNI